MVFNVCQMNSIGSSSEITGEKASPHGFDGSPIQWNAEDV